jgi:hypothetical protein
MITRETIDKVHELTKALEAKKVEASDLLKDAQDRHGSRKQTLSRGGKQQLVEEKELWEEVFHLGPACQAGKILRKEHEAVFAAHDAVKAMADKLKAFCLAELGVDYSQMTVSAYLTLAEGLFSVLLAERK